MITNGKEMNWKGHRLVFESEPSKCFGCFFDDKDECPECDEGIWVEDSPWHTGTPTEEGWYLVALDLLPKVKVNIYRYETDYYNKRHKFNLFDSTVVAWQKINPLRKEKK